MSLLGGKFFGFGAKLGGTRAAEDMTTSKRSEKEEYMGVVRRALTSRYWGGIVCPLADSLVVLVSRVQFSASTGRI